MPDKKSKVQIKSKKSLIGKPTNLSVSVYSLTGRTVGTLNLPIKVFGQKVNKKLLAQAVRVYLANQKTHWSSTKTRSEVKGSTRKIWKQKGTGRARHGGIRAPIFVGGGIALGPKPRKVILDLPKKMRKKALIHALSQKVKDNEVFGISGLDKATGKTKEMAQLLKQLNSKVNPPAGGQKAKPASTLIITDKIFENASRALKNIPSVNILPADQLNILEVLKHHSLILTKDATARLETRLLAIDQPSLGRGGKNE